MTSYRTSTVHTVFNKKAEKVRRETTYLEALRKFQSRSLPASFPQTSVCRSSEDQLTRFSNNRVPRFDGIFDVRWIREIADGRIALDRSSLPKSLRPASFFGGTTGKTGKRAFFRMLVSIWRLARKSSGPEELSSCRESSQPVLPSG